MRFRSHLAASTAAALVLYPRRPADAAALLLAGTLIDLDHLLLYALQTGDWSVTGALRYDRYRHRLVTPGDTRPRYGSLRSLLHEPWLLLPLIWGLALRRTVLRPVAIGLSLHLLLDYLDWPRHALARLRAGGRCEGCGRRGRRLEVRCRRETGVRRYEVLCRACREQARSVELKHSAAMVH